MPYTEKYGTETTVYFPLVDKDATDFEATPVTIASGDAMISKDGGAFASTTNNFAHEGNGIYSLVLTATEMEATKIVVTIIDQTATKEWEDQAVLIQTDVYGLVADAVWDEVLTAATHNIATSAGRRVRNIQDFGIYDLASVWVDEVNGTSSGTTDGEDATVTNRADDFDNAQTIADSVGLTDIHIANGNSITLTAALEGYDVYGNQVTLALGGQNCGGTEFFDFNEITGIATTTGADIKFQNCDVGNVTLPPSHFVNCGFEGTITVGSAGEFVFNDCYSEVAGSGAPVFDFAAVGATEVSFRKWSGGLTVNNMAAGDIMSVDVISGGTITINGTGGTVEVRGLCDVVDGSSGSVSITQSSVVNMTKINEEADTALTDFFTTPAALVDLIWDEPLTAATHNVTTSAGRRLRDTSSNIVWTGMAQGAGTGNNQIQLDTEASSTDGSYDPSVVMIIEGTGAGQSRLIMEYDGDTRTATVDRNWKVNPDATSSFVIVADAGRQTVNEGLARGGSSNTIVLNALASTEDDAYNGQLVFIRSGTGEDQVAIVSDYNGATQTATIKTAQNGWAVTPDTTSGYCILPNQLFTVSDIMETTIEGTVTLAQSIQLHNAALGGKVSGAEGTTYVVRDLADTKNRIVATVDEYGNRSAVVRSYD